MFVLGPVVFVKRFVSMAMTSGFGVGYRNSSCFVYALEPAFPWRTAILFHRTVYLLITIKASCSEIKRQKVHERLKASIPMRSQSFYRFNQVPPLIQDSFLESYIQTSPNCSTLNDVRWSCTIHNTIFNLHNEPCLQLMLPQPAMIWTLGTWQMSRCEMLSHQGDTMGKW